MLTIVQYRRTVRDVTTTTTTLDITAYAKLVGVCRQTASAWVARALADPAVALPLATGVVVSPAGRIRIVVDLVAARGCE